MTRVVVATCLEQPDVQPDDAPFVAALRRRGDDVALAPWNGTFAPFDEADVVVVRSTWDYQGAPAAFEAWLDRLATVRGKVWNDPALMRWNARKAYLLDLAERGAPLPPTRLVSPTAASIGDAVRELDADEVVVKPLYGAGASGLTVVRRDDPAGFARAAAALGGEGLAQPLIPEIRTAGEASLAFFGGEFSHAVVKTPRADSILVHAEHGGSTRALRPAPEHVDAARAVLDMLPTAPGYARVDMVLAGPRPLLMEVEVIEPELFLRHDDGAAERFARIVRGRG